jgi:hypothetical protein
MVVKAWNIIYIEMIYNINGVRYVTFTKQEDQG